MTQYHFTAWLDHGVPDYTTSVLAFHRRVKAQYSPSKGPILVHCRYPYACIVELMGTLYALITNISLFCLSAGIGRTGTFIAIDNILEQLEKEKIVDVPGAITTMRQRRMKMVQTPVSHCYNHMLCIEL